MYTIVVSSSGVEHQTWSFGYLLLKQGFYSLQTVIVRLKWESASKKINSMLCKWKMLDALAMWRPHLALPYDFKLKDREGQAQALLGPQEEPASIPWFHFSFDMLILQSLWNINHLRLINFQFTYTHVTFPILGPL